MLIGVMSKTSYILVLCLVYTIQCQVFSFKRRQSDDQQQAQRPVGRINLKDYGIVKDNRKDESKDDRTEEVELFRPSTRDTFSPRSDRSFKCSDCVDPKYMQHYATKGCVAVMSSLCNCPIRYECPITRSANASDCLFGGRTYRIGSRIPVKNPCRICSCRDVSRGREGPKAQIDCGIGIECPEIFGVRPPKGCYTFYEHDSCCGRDECPDKSSDAKRSPKVCKYGGREYKLGQKIYPDEDPCKICICNDNWDDSSPLQSRACRTHDCEFELDRDFKEGCLPIYHEGTCCPIEYHCPKKLVTSEVVSSGTHCVFEGRKYPIGAKLTHSNVCVDCVCKVPPDFTCVHQSCPTPDVNCYVPKWDNTVCCQKYTCARADAIRDESQLRGGYYSSRNQ